jgi:hypothetical protein
MTREKKKGLENNTNDRQNKRKKSYIVTSNKKYESFNIVSETRDSIYSPPFEQLPRGQIFYSESIIREIVRQELTTAIGMLVKSKNE